MPEPAPTENPSTLILLPTDVPPAPIDLHPQPLNPETLAAARTILSLAPDEEAILLHEEKNSPEQIIALAIAKTGDLNTKASLAERAIPSLVGKRQYSQAVRFLLGGDLHRASLPQFQNPVWIGKLYDQAIEQGDFRQAREVAEIMVNPETRNKVTKYNPRVEEKIGSQKEEVFTPTGQTVTRDTAILGFVDAAVKRQAYRTGWEVREQSAFDRQVQSYLERLQSEPENPTNPHDGAEIFARYQHRPEGWLADQPSPLALRFAEKYCNLLLETGLEQGALKIAREAKLPKAQIKEIIAKTKNHARSHSAQISSSLPAPLF